MTRPYMGIYGDCKTCVAPADSMETVTCPDCIKRYEAKKAKDDTVIFWIDATHGSGWFVRWKPGPSKGTVALSLCRNMDEPFPELLIYVPDEHAEHAAGLMRDVARAILENQ